MSKLINADDIKNDIKTLWDWETVDGIKSSTVLKQALSDIDNMNEAVVRCKDCKYCTEQGDWCQNEKVRSMCCADGLVEHYFGDNHTAFYPDMDFFCAYGERRTANDT